MIPKLEFKFDEEKDLYNIWDACNSKSCWGHDFKKNIPKNILKICKGKKFRACKAELNKKVKTTYKNHLIKEIVEYVNKLWKIREKEYFERLKKIMGEDFYCKKIDVYFTTASRCPYNYNKKHPYFYVSLFNGIPGILSTAGHELMHLQFHNSKYWNMVEKEVGYNKTCDLKEALTVLLNLEFKDLWMAKDQGYPNHQRLREFIEKEWKKEKDFDKLIIKYIKYMKK